MQIEQKTAFRLKLALPLAAASIAVGGGYLVFGSGGSEADSRTDPPTGTATRTIDATPTETATIRLIETPRATAAAVPTPDPTAEITVAPTPEPTPFVTPAAIPKYTPVPTPASTPIRTPEPTAQPTPEPTIELDFAQAEQVRKLINNERGLEGLGPLKLNNSLRTSGENYIMFLYESNLWTHCADSNGDGKIDSPQQRAEWAGYEGGAGEVLTYANTPKDAVERWKASPQHWAAIMNPDATEIGIGYLDGLGTDSVAGEIGIPTIDKWHTC